MKKCHTNRFTVNLEEWQEAFEKSKSFVATLSTSEKIDIIAEGSAGNFTGLNTKDGSASVLDYYWVPRPLEICN